MRAFPALSLGNTDRRTGVRAALSKEKAGREGPALMKILGVSYWPVLGKDPS